MGRSAYCLSGNYSASESVLGSWAISIGCRVENIEDYSVLHASVQEPKSFITQFSPLKVEVSSPR